VDSDLVGIAEVARMARVTRAAVSNWRARFPDFPKPVAELQAGPVFDHGQIRAWLRRRRVPMATVISMINLKGGVGKTTTTVALAEFMDVEYGKRVLVIDLDPQTNATVMLIGDRRWGRLNADKQTIAQLFEDALDPGHHIFDLQASIQRGVGAVEDVTRVSLLPSSIDLIDVQERVLKPVLDEFDVVLVDCPPSMGVVTLNGLRISQGYVIPVIPDVLSTYGIPQIVRRVHDFSEAIQEEIAPLGIVISKYRVQSTVHKNQVELLRAEKDAPVFKTTIPEMNDVAGAAEFKAVSTLRQKWGYKGIYEAYHALAGEILEKASVPE
jgi:chromosome partitioning protein